MLLAEVGWSVAPVPAYATLLLGADPIARHGSREQQQRFLPGVIDGSRILTAGLQEPGRSDPLSPVHHRPSRRAELAAGRGQRAGAGAQLADTVLIPAAIGRR